MDKQEHKGEIVIYKAETGPELRVSLYDETVWLTQAGISELFQTDRSSVAKHLRNIIKSGELAEKSNVQNLHIANSDKPVKFYNLDFILSVGYRVNSKRATQFRIWATQKMRDYLIKGFVVNAKRLPEAHVAKLKELETAHKLIQQALESYRAEGYERELLKIISDYANTWFVLNLYDEQKLAISNVSEKPGRVLNYEEVLKSIKRFRQRLQNAKQASDLFGVEVSHKLASIVGSIDQSFNSKPLYPSLEERAAHLLYFVVKGHPFVDGNKRVGSLLFLQYLIQNDIFYNRRGERKINDAALTAVTLLTAESDPSQKDVIIKLIVNLINKK
ncbi:MAG: hypothetical protein A3H72_00195 [Candidatus Doudnabacteria bacterium RIFCSPLOWO2_02_FULL_48_8]|uniref:Fido domain-containing protein n=1 Tax=Candidatus Doudnabacteria bacterium RIFCSPHIGHO2_01_FULL_46_24 TaxID=1817825 RepID=A0A1F5NT01_9BACT|nr:MAG: hypothetical protein A2720_04550 [Candidatus Doudnabacteria bacterium RIFCSPHIGHO2_01_FULL_46_24]OGE95624.1 MAG: hypothetical protein A3H72_00195 [Candidatus Doudnabacteria bacterium RIFCSPLOWO2_02_FULL_48_8]OGE96130.1 MAG: hypothetical protein A3E98_03410 [Candidatus Doudnabacteria bacterium RIFCSPHIGHO2_12_FULL_48_11]